MCRGKEPGLASLTYEQATSVRGCFAFDAAQDNYACYPGCSAAVKLGIDSPEAIDMGAIGADCPYAFMSGPSCLASGRIDASENSGTGCRWSPKLTGVACCPGE